MYDRNRIGYVLKVFPRISQTFVLTEILANERAGLEMDIFSLRRTDDTRFHAALSRVQSPVFQIPLTSFKASSVLGELREHGRHLPGLWDVVRDTDTSAEDVVQAAHLARHVRDRGIAHLHAHFGTVGTVVARLAAHIAGISYSFTAHAKDIYHEVVEEEELRRKLADAAGVVTVSQFNVDYLRGKYGDDARNVRLIYNGLDMKEFPFSPDGERPPLILGVGRLVEKKGFRYLVEACGLLRDRGQDFRCEIAGDGELKDELRDLVQTLCLENHVSFCGALSQDDVKRKIRGAALLAAPCVHAGNDDRDGLPTILLEAMALGTPCISTPVTGIPEVIRHNETGLMVAERDAGGLADACEKLLGDRAAGRDLARNARRLVEERFDIDRNTAELRAWFDRMSAGNPAGGATAALAGTVAVAVR